MSSLPKISNQGRTDSKATREVERLIRRNFSNVVKEAELILPNFKFEIEPRSDRVKGVFGFGDGAEDPYDP